MGEFAGWSLIFYLLGSICLPIWIPWFIFKLHRHKKLKAELQGKVVLITGANSGLGESLAHAFYACGCRVVLAARREQHLERVKQDLLQSRLDKDVVTQPPIVLPLDLTRLDEIPVKMDQLLRVAGRVDVLVCNAGVSYRGEALTTGLQVDQDIMLINYIAQVALIKALLPSMVLRKSGHIVAISSVQGRIAIPYRSAYTASKHALQAFCDTLRAEVSHHRVDVTVVSPGYIRTNLSINAVTATGDKYGVMDETTKNGYEPSAVAEKVVAAVMYKTAEVTVSDALPKVAILLRTLLPSLFFRLMRNRALRLRRPEDR